MLMSSLATIQANGVYTPETVPIEKTYGLPAEAKKDGTSGPSPGATSNNDEPSSPPPKAEEDAPSGELPSSSSSSKQTSAADDGENKSS